MRAPIDDSVTLVTGASSGIGRAIARQLAARASVLILVARRADRLEQLATELRQEHKAVEVYVQPCDLSDRVATQKMLDAVEERFGVVDILINNAGLADFGMFDLANWDKTQRLLDVNIMALCYLTHRLVGPMVKQHSGGILMISSGWGLTFTSGLSVYIGSKHFVTSFTEALRLDVANQGVVITQACPGPVATEFEQVMGNFTGRGVPGFIEISAERCAASALKAFERGRALVIPGILIRIVMLLAVLTPRAVLRLVYRPVARWLRTRQQLGQRKQLSAADENKSKA